MADRQPPEPSDEERPSDRELLAALGEHEPIGERYHRTGEIPVSTARQPGMEPSANAGMQRDPTPVKPIPRPPRFVGRYLLRPCVVGRQALEYGRDGHAADREPARAFEERTALDVAVLVLVKKV